MRKLFILCLEISCELSQNFRRQPVRLFWGIFFIKNKEEENIQNQPISQVNWGSDGFQDKGARNFELILKIQDQNKKF
jgi:hypothetical protein